MAGGVSAPLLRISSAERRRLVLYRIAKMRKEKELRQSNKESTPRSYKKTFSLEDHKLQIEIERIEKQRKQAMNKAKEEKHMFKMSVKVPTRQGQEYFSQYGEQFRANGDVLQHGSVTRLPQMLKSFHEENEKFVETYLRTIKHGSRSPSSPCRRSIISALLKHVGIIDFLTTATTAKDREFLTSALSACCTEENCACSDGQKLLSKDVVNSELASSPEFQKLQGLFHGKNIKDSESRTEELEKLYFLLDRYGVSAQNKDSCLPNVLSFLDSTPDIISHEINNSITFPGELASVGVGEDRSSCFIKPSKSVVFQDDKVVGNECCFPSKEKQNSALIPRVRKISTNIEGTDWLFNREAFCSSPSKRLDKHDDSAVSSDYDMRLGNGDDNQLEALAPISTVDSECMRTELYARYGAWTDQPESETGLPKTEDNIKKLEMNEEPKIIYSRADCETMEKSAHTLHSGSDAGGLKRNKKSTCFGCRNGRMIKSERKCASTHLSDTSNNRHADRDPKKSSYSQDKAKSKKNERNNDVNKSTANTRTSSHGTKSKTNTSIYNISSSTKIIYSTHDVKPFPPRGRNKSSLSNEKLQSQLSQQVTSRVQCVHIPDRNYARSQNNSVPARVPSHLINNNTRSQKSSNSDTHRTNVVRSSDGNNQAPQNITSGYKLSRANGVNTTKKVPVSGTPTYTKSVILPAGQHTENGNGTLMVSGKKLQARSVVSKDENDRKTRSKMEELFKKIENLRNTRRQSRTSARSRSASMRTRPHNEGSRASSTRSRAGSAVENRDHNKHGLPVGQRTRKPKDNESQYRRAKMFPVEVWSSKD